MKFAKQLVWAGLLLTFFLTQGCFSLKQIGSPTSGVMEISNGQNLTIVKHFERKKTVHHFILGLVSPDDAGIEKLIAEAVQLAGGSGAVNIKIKYQQTFVNGLVNGITYGIYAPFTLTVEGDVIQ